MESNKGSSRGSLKPWASTTNKIVVDPNSDD